MTLVAYSSGNAKLTKYAGDKLAYTFGRLGGLAGSTDGYDYKKYKTTGQGGGTYCVPRTPDPPGSHYMFGSEGSSASGICERTDSDGHGGVWVGYGDGSAFRPADPGGSELAWHVTKLPDPTKSAFGFRLYVGADVCGDGQLSLGEHCDDGNTKDGDGCSAKCQRECVSLAFDGKNDYAKLGPSAKLATGSSHTVEAWIWPSTPPKSGWRYIIAQGWNKSVIRLQVQGGVLHHGSAQAKLPVGRWTHIAATTAGKDVRLFIDGKLAATGKGPGLGIDGKAPIIIGGGGELCDTCGTDYPWYGRIESVRVSSGVRYGGGFVPTFPLSADANTVGLWQLQAGTGTKLVDSGSANAAGKAVGATWSKTSPHCWSSGVCGDGKKAPWEGCDDGNKVNADACNVACSPNCASLHFDGKNDYLAVPHAASLNLSATSFTVEVWYLKESLNPADNSGIVSKFAGNGPNENGWAIVTGGEQASKPILAFSSKINDKGSAAVGKKTIALGKWTHVAATRDQKTGDTRLWVNGKPYAKGTTATPAKTTYGLHFGVWRPPPTQYWWHGQLDEVRISTKIRYTAEFTPPAVATADKDTLALWHLNEGSGSVAKDASGNGHHGKLLGASWVKKGPACTAGGSCGDGLQAAWERCDDGNTKDGDGCSATCTPEVFASCRAALAKHPGAKDGKYLLDPDGAGPGAPFKAYCDMTKDGGGWTRVAYMSGKSGGGGKLKTAAGHNEGGCEDASGLCKLSDARIKALLAAHAGTNDRFRLVGPTLPKVKRLFWDTTATWAWDSAAPAWFRPALSLGGGHCDCKPHKVMRGVGFYPGAKGCGCVGKADEVFFLRTVDDTVGAHVSSGPFSWWVR